ncbi:tyrosine-type recombinase/integrase [Streptomyces sp. NPDC026665]|uniref:tyrosine-type recombinase/integrase n=1 Tax=Streptomyces sp. NPDC026665 TaxID=3154798 RepID=UPI0033DDCB99
MEWLEDHTDPNWRQAEWQAPVWLFTGSPDGSRTNVSVCRTVACSALVAPANGYCWLCKEAQKRSPLQDEEFARTFQPVRQTARPGAPRPTCQVTRDGRRCVRPTLCKGLCRSHYTQLAAYKKKHGGPSGWDARATPFTQAGCCLVPTCELSVLFVRGLCRYHQPKFKAHRRTEPTASVEQWALRQIPYLAAHQFSLAGLLQPLRQEVLYGLQQADPWLRVFDPCHVRRLVRDLADTLTLTGDVPDSAICPRSTTDVLRLLSRVRTEVKAGHAQHVGLAPAAHEVLNLRALGQRARTSAAVRYPKTIDLRPIRQRWLRELLQTWTVQQCPDTETFARTLRGVELASAALARRPATDDPSVLGFDDVTAIVEAFRTAPRLDGAPAGGSYRASIATSFFALIDYSRRSGIAPTLSAAFVRDSLTHRITVEEPNDDETGKAIPEPVIRQLDAHLHLLGQGTKVSGRRALDAADLQLMYRTLYILLRDTGRRPNEIVSLPRDCLETRSDQISLVWNNHKARRMRRRLPITADTAQAVRTWQTRRTDLEPALPTAGTGHLFPALTPLAASRHLYTGYLGQTLRHWVDSIPHLYDEGTGPDGRPPDFDRSLIYPYAFRHSYAQRHADAGTPLDVLRELMDHKSVRTTQRYYTVSLQRKREAVTKLAAHVVDHHGRPHPCSNTTYELRSVAVPYGGCTEPSNVKAGGSSCPIRFQCAGCGFYRPDPSYLPAIEQHINELRADRESATAMDAAGFVTTALTAQITAFTQVADRMRRRLAALPAQERADIEEASTILRKARVGTTHTLLPLTPTPRTSPS